MAVPLFATNETAVSTSYTNNANSIGSHETVEATVLKAYVLSDLGAEFRAYPSNGERPRPLLAGKRYLVSIDYLRGSALGEEVNQYFCSFNTGPDGRVLAASPVKGMRQQDLAKDIIP
jgi:hypothetical protein